MTRYTRAEIEAAQVEFGAYLLVGGLSELPVR
jgi:hypothetical protein